MQLRCSGESLFFFFNAIPLSARTSNVRVSSFRCEAAGSLCCMRRIFIELYLRLRELKIKHPENTKLQEPSDAASFSSLMPKH